jgi:uncharacterized protein
VETESRKFKESLKRNFMRQTAKLVTLQLLRAYKWAISPLFPPACRYVPTCSEYAMEAVERYGVLRGGLLALARLLRCHPLARGGYDPVVSRPRTTRPRTTNDQPPATRTSYRAI